MCLRVYMDMCACVVYGCVMCVRECVWMRVLICVGVCVRVSVDV